jgi:phosphatidylinositol glycan class B
MPPDSCETKLSPRDARTLAFIALAALVVRVLPSSILHYQTFPDEIFQYYEQAHRLVFGSGVVPWEFHEGTRSWLLSLGLAGVMYACSLFSDSPQVYFFVCRTILGVLSLSVIYVAYQYAPLRQSFAGRFSAAFLCALAPYMAFFGAFALTEVVAAHLVFLAFVLFRQSWSRLALFRFVIIGVLCGLALWLRIQLTPLLPVLALYFCGTSGARWRSFGAGFIGVILVVGGILDAITWGTPFHSLWANIHANVAMGVSASFETTPFFGYFATALDHWIPVALLALLVLVGSVRQPIFALCGLVILVSHSFVPHKELRFLYPALCCFTVSLGFGIAQCAHWIAQAGSGRLRNVSGPIALAGVGVSIAAAFSVQPSGDWVRNSGNVRALLAIRDDPHLCGVAVRGISWSHTGGYATFHRDVPIFFDTAIAVDHFPSGFPMLTSVIVNGRELGEAGPYTVLLAEPTFEDDAFHKRQCFPHGGQSGFDETCIFDRVSGCVR